MVIGLGVDVVKVKEIEQNVDEHRDRYLQRIFTEREIEYSQATADPYQRLAARFAAKEAVMKALGTGWTGEMNWKSVEIINDEITGRPSIVLHDHAEKLGHQIGLKHALLSFTHTEDEALAVVILEG